MCPELLIAEHFTLDKVTLHGPEIRFIFKQRLGDLQVTLFAKIYNKIREREGLQKVLKNTLWLFYDRFFRMGFSLIVGALLARYLAPSLYGVFNYAFSFVALFAVLGSLGLDNILIREMVKSPDKENIFLGTAFLLKLAGGFLIVIFSVGVIVLTKPNDPLSQALVLIVAAGYVLQSVNVIDLYFQSRIKSKYTVISSNAAFIVSSAAKLTCIFFKASLIVFAWLYIAEIVISAFGLLIFYHRLGRKIKLWQFDQKVAVNLLRDSWPLILSGAAIMIYMRIDQVMVGNMLGNVALGLYSSAVKIAEVWYFIPMAIVSSTFPSILEAKKREDRAYTGRMQLQYHILFLSSFLICLVLSLFSKNIIFMLYGAEYIGASSVLSIYVWAGVAVSLGVASNQYLISENFTKVSLLRTIIGCIANVILNLVLIPRYGIEGSAWATFISYFISVFSILMFKETKAHGVLLLKSLNPFKILFKTER